jgi:hypothetical protein
MIDVQITDGANAFPDSRAYNTLHTLPKVRAPLHCHIKVLVLQSKENAR